MLERTIHQLDSGNTSPELAREMGQLGYIQWLGSLNGSKNYVAEAKKALAKSAPFSDASPAVGVFCDLLQASIDHPLALLGLELPTKHRRGGSRARRATF